MNKNPYAAPNTPSFDLESQAPSSERIRRTYLKHEASVKSIGTLYFLAGLLLSGVTLVALSHKSADPSFSLPIVLTLIALAVFQIGVAIGLHKLKSWARIPAILLAIVGLLGFPIGTLISAYFLYLLCGKNGSMVFSPEYAKIIAETPHIKYRTSKIVWIFLAILIAVIVIAIFASIRTP